MAKIARRFILRSPTFRSMNLFRGFEQQNKQLETNLLFYTKRYNFQMLKSLKNTMDELFLFVEVVQTECCCCLFFKVLTPVGGQSAPLEPNAHRNVRLRVDAARKITYVCATEVVATVAFRKVCFFRRSSEIQGSIFAC